MQSRIRFFLFITCAILCLFSCATQTERRKHELIALEPDFFHAEDDFVYLGDIESLSCGKLKIYFNENIFSNNRAAYRLVLFGEDNSVWQCKVGDKPRIDSNVILFPYEQEFGNTIAISESIPSEVWLDGEIVKVIKIR